MEAAAVKNKIKFLPRGEAQDISNLVGTGDASFFTPLPGNPDGRARDIHSEHIEPLGRQVDGVCPVTRTHVQNSSFGNSLLVDQLDKSPARLAGGPGDCVQPAGSVDFVPLDTAHRPPQRRRSRFLGSLTLFVSPLSQRLAFLSARE